MGISDDSQPSGGGESNLKLTVYMDKEYWHKIGPRKAQDEMNNYAFSHGIKKHSFYAVEFPYFVFEDELNPSRIFQNWYQPVVERRGMFFHGERGEKP